MRTETFTTPLMNMLCRQCEGAVRAALLPARGVVAVKASFPDASVTVTYDPDLVSKDELISRLDAAGYPPGKSLLGGRRADVLTALLTAALSLLFHYAPMLSIDLPADLTFGALFGSGVLAGLHCIGMCGGILLASTAKRRLSGSGRAPLFSSLAWNMGRILACCGLGACFGALGSVLSFSSDLTGLLHAAAGAAVVLIGLSMWGIVPSLREALSFPVLRRQKKRPHRAALPFLSGILTAFLPCGISGAMWMAAMASGSAVRGALCMLFFFLGTGVFMMVPGLLQAMVPKKARPYLLRLNVILVISMGIDMFWNAV